MKGILIRIKDQFFAQKYRFDLGLQFLALLNFALLVITASDKLKTYFHINNTGNLILIMIPLAFVCMWCFGFFLDKVLKAQYMTEQEQMKRSKPWILCFNKLDTILDKLEEEKK